MRPSFSEEASNVEVPGAMSSEGVKAPILQARRVREELISYVSTSWPAPGVEFQRPSIQGLRDRRVMLSYCDSYLDYDMVK